MFEELKERVFKANIELFKKNIIIYTWGNVSEIDRKNNIIAIKPSGVPYEDMKVDDIVVIDINGIVIDGNLKPSSDTLTHLEIYKNFKTINAITHTHSIYATAFAQAGVDIKPFGTTQADYFCGSVKVTRELKKEEVENNYELNTGKVIAETNFNPELTPAILVKSHGPFVFGKNALDSVQNAVILEEIAKINHITLQLNQNTTKIKEYILNKHYKRKHGKNAYYGQKSP